MSQTEPGPGGEDVNVVNIAFGYTVSVNRW